MRQLGYQISSWRPVKEELESLEAKRELALLQIKLAVSAVLSILLLIGSYIPRIMLLSNPFIMWLLATPVQFWVGAQFYSSAWRSLKHGSATMNTLIVLGTSVAYFYSVFVVLFESMFVKSGLPTHLYFDSAVIIITVILLGNFLETRAKGKMSQAIRSLMVLQPKVALVLREGSWQKVSTELVVVDDVLRIKPGSNIPVDGIITSGSSSINESMVTGESMPVFKKEGDEVIGGTVSMSGFFEMKATKIGTETVLAKIIEMVRMAQASKAPVQKLVDTISAYFVPIVIACSFLTSMFWFMFGPEPQVLYAVTSMVAVLIIACPCALGLATPTSIMVGIGRGAQEGILIKGAQTLEIAGKINVVIFDKTGTLTRGQQEVHGFELVKDVSEIFLNLRWDVPDKFTAETFVLSLIYALEDLSEHPISQAVIRYFQHKELVDISRAELLKIKDFESVAGLGLRAFVNNHKIILGSRKLMDQEGVTMPSEVDRCAIEWAEEAKSVSFVAIDNKLIAYFCIADTIRENVDETIAKLKSMHIKTMLVTGDNELAAQAVARVVGIDEVLANVLPADKAKEVEKLCVEGRVVAMVGDGINDAPALAAADVGIAMGSGTDVALQAAEVALLRNDISLVPKVILLSKATIRNIRQNLVWAFGYNIILIPVAMGILYPLFGITLNPMLAGAAMAFSSLSVVLNALRLRWVSL